MAATAEANAQARMIQAGAFDKKAQAEQITAATAEANAQAQIQASAIGLTAPFVTNDEPYVIGEDELFDCVDENEPVEQAVAAAAVPGADTAATTPETAATAAASPEAVCAPTNVRGYIITKELESELRDIEVRSREETLKELRGNSALVLSYRDQVAKEVWEATQREPWTPPSTATRAMGPATPPPSAARAPGPSGVMSSLPPSVTAKPGTPSVLTTLPPAFKAPPHWRDMLVPPLPKAIKTIMQPPGPTPPKRQRCVSMLNTMD